ncbi:hypothetical protein [Egbenema bharatensis]|uniref:hypothetical protein n=1 Tax=Egbenema bharatensis TaxID=3463334 RepID=UPI003A89B04E
MDLAGEKTLGAIATMVLKFLGLGKKSEYFLEAEPESPNGSKPAPQPAASETKAAPEPVEPESQAAQDVAAAQLTDAETPDSVEAVVVETVPKSAPEASEAGAEPKKAKAKKTKVKKSETKAVEAEPVKETVTASIAQSAPQTKNFATEHLLPNNTPRRRPGPSLDMFKEMARQVKMK